MSLRLLRPADALVMLRAEDEPSRVWLRRGRSMDLAAMLRLTYTSSEGWRDRRDLRVLGLEEVATRRLVGVVEVCTQRSTPELAEGEVNIAYQVFPSARGRGYGTRAALLACRVQRSLALGQVAVLTIHLDNIASLRVAYRAGFESSGGMITDDGQWLAVFRKTITAADDSLPLCYDERSPAGSTTPFERESS